MIDYVPGYCTGFYSIVRDGRIIGSVYLNTAGVWMAKGLWWMQGATFEAPTRDEAVQALLESLEETK